MTRPRSIRLFEIFWLASLALMLVGTALVWPSLVEGAAAMDASGRLSAGTLGVLAGVSVAILAGVELALWYFTARRGSVVAKWLVVLLTAYNVYDLATADRAAGTFATAPGMLSAVALLLQVLAAGLLFAPDARRWFAAGNEA